MGDCMPGGPGERRVAVMVRLPDTGRVKVVEFCGRDDGGMGVTRAPASPRELAGRRLAGVDEGNGDRG